jgi:hypothetical protein
MDLLLDKSRIGMLIMDIHAYYTSGGYNALVAKTVINTLSHYLLLFIFYFVVDCINYDAILNITHTIDHISDIIRLERWFPTNPYLVICFAFYVIYLLCITYTSIYTIYSYREIRRIYRDRFDINDGDLLDYSWSDIVGKLQTLSNGATPVYSVNAMITRSDNFIIALVRSDMLYIPRYINFSRILEWNILFAVISPLKNLASTMSNNIAAATNLESSIYNSIYPLALPAAAAAPSAITAATILDMTPLILDRTPSYRHVGDDDTYARYGDRYGGVDGDVIGDEKWAEYYGRVAYRFNLIIFINVCSLPFAILIILIYFLLDNGAKVYYKPSIVFNSQIARLHKWSLRYYNELPMAFLNRITLAATHMHQYCASHYYNRIVRNVTDICVFFIGSIFIIMVALSFVASDFAYLTVFYNKNILWCIGILGSILVIYHSSSDSPMLDAITPEKEANIKKIQLSLTPIHYITFDNLRIKGRLVYNLFVANFTTISKELITIILMPYILFRIRAKILAERRMHELVTVDPDIGIMCKYSDFSNTHALESDVHMLLSFYRFRTEYPDMPFTNVLLNHSIPIVKFTPIH